MEISEDVDVTVRNSDIDISLGLEKSCTENSCIEDNDINKLQCGQCKRKVHYKCTRLPAYQLQRYLVASLGQYYSKFLCSNCVVVPDSIQKELAAADNIVSLENELTMQKEKIESYERELKDLRKLVASQRNSETSYFKKRKFGDRNNNQEEVAVLSDENNIINKENQNGHLNIQDINNMFEKRFELMENKMAEMIKQNIPKPQNTYSNTSIPLSYAKVANTNNPTNTNFRNIVVAAKNEELIEEKDKRMRENNIIIHGKCESENNEDNDKQFVNDMIKDISVGAITTKSITRLGKSEHGKNRPIKVVFNNNEEKSKVMSNLRFMKGKELYNRISITDDYTMSERKMVKDYVEMAKQQNKELGNEAKTIIIVRGTPKNGLYLKEVTKEKRVITQTEAMQISSS